MAGTKALSLDQILNHPTVKAAVEDASFELRQRRAFVPPICKVFSSPFTVLEEIDRYRFSIDPEARRRLPGIIANKVQIVTGRAELAPEAAENCSRRRNIGIVFSGGPAPGGHNVIAGLFDAAKRVNPENRVFGFLVGPDGVVENESIEITLELVDRYRNLGGFTMIKTGRSKIDSRQKVDLSKATCKGLNLDALVIVGGDDSNTNAAFLAQEMLADGIQVIGVPKTIDGDIQVCDDDGHVLCAVSFGFHTAARAFANAVAGLANDASSDIKYYHVCKVMGRVASHLALEVALQAHPNMTVIGEDLVDFVDEERLEKAGRENRLDYTAFGMTLRHLSRLICEGIVQRAAAGKNYGIIVIPEGVLEFINEVEVFIMKLNTIIAEYNRTRDRDFHSAFPSLEQKLEFLHRLAQRSRDDSSFKLWNTRDEDLFNDLPEFFQEGLLTERDSHGNFQFSQIHTERVLMGLVHDYLNILKEKGLYTLGIQSEYVAKTLRKGGLDPDRFGPAIFQNYGAGDHLLTKTSIISAKTLRQELERAGLLQPQDPLPPVVEGIYKKTVPSFKT
ncbi:MAG: phosphofructokinase, partial [Desulfobacteraceae bacterium]